MAFKEISLLFVLSVILSAHARSLDGIRSDVIETKFGPETDDKGIYSIPDSPGVDDNPKKPGWMVRTFRKLFKFPKDHNQRRQLMRFGDITARVSNSLGGSAMKVAAIVERLCKMLKTVIPIVAAVCNVGQFQFCSSADAPLQLSEAMSQPMNSMDLSVPDK